MRVMTTFTMAVACKYFKHKCEGVGIKFKVLSSKDLIVYCDHMYKGQCLAKFKNKSEFDNAVWIDSKYIESVGIYS